jgi:hypothetical protein
MTQIFGCFVETHLMTLKFAPTPNLPSLIEFHMCHLMSPHVTLVRKSFFANITFIWLLSSMDPYMSRQILFEIESFLTY